MRAGETLLCLVRHGETDWNASGRLQGRTDVPLNARGRQQARLVARELLRRAEECRASWTAVYSSPLVRALETARSIAGAVGVAPQVCEALVERAFGPMEGLTWEELAARFPDWRSRPGEVPGLEGPEELRSRAVAALEGIARAHPGGRVVVVSHGALLNAFLHTVTGGEAGTGKTRLANAAISIVVGREGAWRVEELNRTEHLAGAPE